MYLYKLPGGDILRRDDQAIVVELAGPRRVLSTSYLNGGIREDLRFLFNYCEIHGDPDEYCDMRAPTNEAHLAVLAAELGLERDVATGLSTAAKMKYAVTGQERYHDFTVTAVVTAGIDNNGSRAGDPAVWHERQGRPVLEEPGTINILVFVDADLPAGTLARALVTVTEAKTAALQEVLAPSCYSRGLATGSGTDGVIIVSNRNSPTLLTSAGQHSKLGEYIGRTVKETVAEALVAEAGFHAYARGSMLKRLARFGINEDRLWHYSQAGSITASDVSDLCGSCAVVDLCAPGGASAADDACITNDACVADSVGTVGDAGSALDTGSAGGMDAEYDLGSAGETGSAGGMGAADDSGSAGGRGSECDLGSVGDKCAAYAAGESSDEGEQFFSSTPQSDRISAMSRREFTDSLQKLDGNSRLIACASLYAHLLDLLYWKLIDVPEALRLAETLLSAIETEFKRASAFKRTSSIPERFSILKGSTAPEETAVPQKPLVIEGFPVTEKPLSAERALDQKVIPVSVDLPDSLETAAEELILSFIQTITALLNTENRSTAQDRI